MAKKSEAKYSPMMEQYFAIKNMHPDKIIFYRLGDFYEMFFEDAKIASRELDLTLTGRNCGQEERAPMCGVPFHSYETYLSRLIAKGYKVAICEQVEDPATAKGLVRRDIIRVVTPGTVIESEMLDEGTNNYLCSLYLQDDRVGLCCGDVSTGELFITSLPFDQDIVSDELAVYAPKEIVANPNLAKHPLCEALTKRQHTLFSQVKPESLTDQIYQEMLQQHFADHVQQLQADPVAAMALRGWLFYLSMTQLRVLSRFTLHIYQKEMAMQLGANERANLEITCNQRTREKAGSLLWVMDKTRTSMGRRHLKQELERPLIDKAAIEQRLDGVQALTSQSILLSEISSVLEGIYDIERLLARILYGTVNPRELNSLKQTAQKLPELLRLIREADAPIWTLLCDQLDPLSDLADDIANVLQPEPPISSKEGKLVRQGYSQEVDALQDLLANGKQYLMDMEAAEKERTGIKNLRITFNKVFGYSIEISKSQLHLVPEDYMRKQTLTNGERFITAPLKELESQILTAGEKVNRLEYEIFVQLRERVCAEADRIKNTAKAIAQIDFLHALARIALDYGYCRPMITTDDRLEITEGRHPVVERFDRKLLFVPNDTFMNGTTDQLLMITGPNMAGKSTYMRQVALITIMAQVGSFVPAKAATIGIADRVFTRIGASDDLNSGQSTFMVEMSEMAHILTNATPHSLILLDEVGRGTSTYDGMSIARAAAEYLVTNDALKSRTLFATHYHELCSLEGEYPGVKNYNIAVKKRGDSITFLRRIVPGGADDSYGVEVALLAGVPQPVIVRAREILKGLEADGQKPMSTVVVSEDTQAQTDTEATVLQKLASVDPTVLTPIEAMNLLYQLHDTLKNDPNNQA